MSKLFELFDAIKTDPSVISATLVIWSIVLGIIIALFITFYNRKIIGSFFRALVTSGAIDEETALTLDQINQSENDAVISRLRRSESFRRSVHIINPEGTEETSIIINKETRFYIEEKDYTKVRDQWGETSESIWGLIGGVVGMLIIGTLLMLIVASGMI